MFGGRQPTLDEIRDAAAAGGNAAAEQRQQTPNPSRGEVEVEHTSVARRDETSAEIYRTSSVVDAQLALERSAALAAEAAHQQRLARRDEANTAQQALNERSKPKLGIETPAQRAVREASERHQAVVAAAQADPSILERQARDAEAAAAKARFEQDLIQTPAAAREVAARLRQAREQIEKSE